MPPLSHGMTGFRALLAFRRSSVARMLGHATEAITSDDYERVLEDQRVAGRSPRVAWMPLPTEIAGALPRTGCLAGALGLRLRNLDAEAATPDRSTWHQPRASTR